jgi:hypothetical protein
MAERRINHEAQSGWAQALAAGRAIEAKIACQANTGRLSASRSRHFSNRQTKSGRLIKAQGAAPAHIAAS